MKKILLTFIRFLITITFMLGCDNNLDKQPEPPCAACPIDFNLTDSEPAWSPDGEWIAFVHTDITTKPGIYLISPDGSKIKQWHNQFAETPAWSPDGQWIAFSQNAQIWKKKIDGDSLEQLTFEGRNFFPAWSPEGNLIVHNQSICTGRPCGLWLINLNDSTHKPITPFGNFPDFHSINNTILYQRRWVGSSGDVYGDSLFYYDYSSNHSVFFTTLQDPTHDNRYLKINSTATKIAFSSQPRNKPYFKIWTMNADGSNLQQLTDTQAYSCAWSSDGKYIVYTDSRKENGRLWVMDEDGKNKRQLTFEHHF
jgi:TolB protein